MPDERVGPVGLENAVAGGRGTLELTGPESELVAEEARAVAQSLPDPEARARYGRLAEAAAACHIAGELVPALERLLELGLETGRVGRRYTAEGEQALLRLYQRTPRGTALRQAADEVNRALESLRGQVLRGLAVGVRGPSDYALTVTTDAGRLSVRLGRDGARVESVEVEL
jgi:hypothetical protein